MAYILLLSLFVGTSNIHAMNEHGKKEKESGPVLQFPTSRVHRFLRNSERDRITSKIELTNQINRERRLVARFNARKKAEEEINVMYAQVDRTAEVIRAAIDLSILEKINLEGLD